MRTEDENEPSALTHPQPSTTEGGPHFSMEQHITETESHLEKIMPQFAALEKNKSLYFPFLRHPHQVLAPCSCRCSPGGPKVPEVSCLSLGSSCCDLAKATWGRKGLFQLTAPGYRHHCREVKAPTCHWPHHIHNQEPRACVRVFSSPFLLLHSPGSLV